MKKFNFILGAFIVGLSFTSCKKEGCTDNVATNYSEEAKKDDGSCNYTSRVALWWSEATADNLWYEGADVITFEIDGQVVGSMSTNLYNVTVPECGDSGVPGGTIDLGSQKSKNVTIKGYDQDGYLFWDTSMNITAGTCHQQQMNF